jgi:Chaperone of endosialidase
LKKNIEELSPVLGKILQLKAKQYQFIDAGETTKKSTGFISQEVVDLFPELVNSFKRSAEDPTLYFGLNYAGFSVIAIKAIQEQQQQIQSQQQTIDAQNKKLEDFEKRLEALEKK